MTQHAQTAAAIRSTLKAAFPQTTFRVRSESFAGGDSVDVSWVDGPTTDEVERYISRYEYGHFDGMSDIYEMDNYRPDIPQVKYVLTHREYSYEALCKVVAELNDRRGYALVPTNEGGYPHILPESDKPVEGGYGYQSHEIRPVFHAMSF